MRIHILGICGTFMSGIALLAKESGYSVSGSDLNVYPPMSTQLAAQGIQLMHGYDPKDLDPAIDCVIVGNVISRGNPVMEHVLANNIPFASGPEWLAKTILRDRWVLAVSGTHGKTTTTSLLTWILEHAGLAPGFLVGGVPENFGISARLGDSPYFVIEADEYDSAFFDKRPKFIHYHPKTAILNNLEYDHADIYPDLAAIQQQFQYLVRTIPNNGLIVHPQQDDNLTTVLEKGCWTPVTTFGAEGAVWQAQYDKADGSELTVLRDGKIQGSATWQLVGKHNVNNALAAIAAAEHAGVAVSDALQALATFKNVKRRLEVRGRVNDITVYDDFAHHPTAIATTLEGLRARVGAEARIIAVLEFGSYTMRTGVHKDHIGAALQTADVVLCKRPDGADWGLEQVVKQLTQPAALHDTVDALVDAVAAHARPGDHVIVMSNSGFGGIHEKLLQAVQAPEAV